MTKYTWAKETDTAGFEMQRAQREANAEANAKAEAAKALQQRYELAQKQQEEKAAQDAIQAELDRAQRAVDAKWISETRQKSASDNYLWLGCAALAHGEQCIELFELLQGTRNQYLVLQAEANAK